MKLKITWDGNADGKESAFNQRDEKLRLWVLVTDERGQQIPEPLLVTAKVRDTRFIGWLRRVAPRRATGRSPTLVAKKGARSVVRGPWLTVNQPEPTRAEFLVRGECQRSLPFWVHVRARRKGAEAEAIDVFVVPSKNRLLSFIFVPIFALALAYSSWLWLTLTSDTVPGGFSAIAGTTWAVLGPFIAFASPFFSATVRRVAQDALLSGGAAVAALWLALWLHRQQQPVYIENGTPGAIHAGGAQQPIVIPPGAAVVVPRDQLEATWLKAVPELKQGKESGLPEDHWFKSESLCLRQPGMSNPDNSSPGLATDRAKNRCLQLRAASMFTRLQSWLALGEKLQIGCTAPQALESDAITEWTKSGSCRHDPNLKVTRSLHEHLVSVGLSSGALEPCSEPNGTVVLQPFRVPSQPSDAIFLRKPLPIALDWPQVGGAKSAEETPSFRFTSSGRIARLDLEPAKDGDRPCSLAYPVACPEDKSQRCATLYVPPTELSASLTLGAQELGKLWCEMKPARIFGVRLHANVVTFNVVDSDGRARSRYSSTADVSGAWAAWCEPPPLSQTDRADTPHLKAEVVLPRDWQPVKEWAWDVPAASMIRQVQISLQDRGHWGTINCSAPPGVPLRLSLQLVNVPGSQRVRRAFDGNMDWESYVESTLFPHWIWRCGAQASANLTELTATLDDKALGKLNSAGHFVPYSGAVCLIDPTSGERVPGPAPAHTKNSSASDHLRKFPVKGCDTERSIFAMVGK